MSVPWIAPPALESKGVGYPDCTQETESCPLGAVSRSLGAKLTLKQPRWPLVNFLHRKAQQGSLSSLPSSSLSFLFSFSISHFPSYHVQFTSTTPQRGHDRSWEGICGLPSMSPHGRRAPPWDAVSPHLYYCQQPLPGPRRKTGGDEEAGVTVQIITANLPEHLHCDRQQELVMNCPPVLTTVYEGSVINGSILEMRKQRHRESNHRSQPPGSEGWAGFECLQPTPSAGCHHAASLARA